MTEDEAKKRAGQWLKRRAERWGSYSHRRRWFLATSCLLVIFGALHGLLLIKASFKPNTTAPVLDGAWCDSPAASDLVRNIITAPGVHLCLLEQDPNILGVPASAIIGDAVTHYSAHQNIPVHLHVTWVLTLAGAALALGWFMASDDIFLKPPTT